MTKKIERCAEFERLQTEVNEILGRLTELTAEQREAFRTSDASTFANLDKEIERVIGAKERAIGSLRQHVQEHGCQETAATAQEF